ACAQLADLLLQLLNISSATDRQSIAAIHKAMNENPVYPVLPGHAQQGVEMVLVGVHAAIRKQAAEMKLASTTAGAPYAFQQNRIGEEIAILHHHINLGNVHVHNAACANIEMAHLTVAHLARGQPHVASAGMNER